MRRLELFVAVVDHSGFSAAAREIHVAQPSISLAVGELERELGVQLVVRSRGGVVATPAGEALLGPARRALREVARGREAVAAVTGVVAGHLDVATLPTLAADPLAAMVGRFRRAHPGVTVRISAPSAPVELVEAVRGGAAELGITEAGPINEGLVEVQVSSQELLVVMPAGERDQQGRLALADLAGVPLVLTAPGTSLRNHVEEGLAQVGVVPQPAVETAQRDALIPLVLAGAGATLLPAALATSAAALGAVVRATEPALSRTVALVHRAEAVSPAGARFLELAADS